MKNRHDLYFDLYGTKKSLVFVLFSFRMIFFHKRKNTLYSLKSRRYGVFSFGADNGSRTRLCSLGSCRSTDELYPHLLRIIADLPPLCNTKSGDTSGSHKIRIPDQTALCKRFFLGKRSVFQYKSPIFVVSPRQKCIVVPIFGSNRFVLL